jgi:hypothetical protein
MKKSVELSKVQVVGGTAYGPGVVEVDAEIAKRFKADAMVEKKATEKKATEKKER